MSVRWILRWTAGVWRRPGRSPRHLSGRYHGSLAAITDSERRSLRPIGISAYAVASRTGLLLADLVAIPGVQIFQGVRPAGTNLPLVPHVVSAGRHFVLVESVAWPPGRYAAPASGRIHCVGQYIGQSAAPLIATVRLWRTILPRRYRVSAVVVVHRAGEGELRLPVTTTDELVWLHADEAADDLRRRLPADRQVANRNAVAVLLAAARDRPEQPVWR